MPRESEIAHTGLIIDVQQDVRGLEIAMNHPSLVREMHHFGSRTQVGGSPIGIKGPLGPQQIGQTPGRHVFHRNEGSSLHFTHLVERDDARVLQLGDRQGFNAKTLSLGITRCRSSTQEFECHDPFQLPMLGPINHACAALAKSIEYLVFTKGAARAGRLGVQRGQRRADHAPRADTLRRSGQNLGVALLT